MQTANLPQIRSCLDCGDVLPASDFYPVNRSDSNRNFGEEWRDTTDILHSELISRASQSSGVITDVTEKGTAQIVRAVLDAGNRFYGTCKAKTPPFRAGIQPTTPPLTTFVGIAGYSTTWSLTLMPAPP